MKMRILAILSFLLVFAGCKKDLLTISFNLDYDAELTLPANIPVNTPFSVKTPPFPTNTSSTVGQHNTSIDKLTHVELRSCVLTITAPQGKTFSFLKSLDLFLEAPELPEVQIASRKDIPDNIGNTLEMEVSSTELLQYLKKETFTLRISAQTDELLSDNVDMNVHMTFRVTAAPLK